MGILSALFAAVSGLNANGTNLSIIGNNIANASTEDFNSGKAAIGTGTETSVFSFLRQNFSVATLLQVAADPKAAGVMHRPEDTAPIADLS